MPGSTTLFAMGKVVGDVFYLTGDDNNQFYKVETSGVINGTSAAAAEFAAGYCKQKVIAAGYNVESTAIDVKSYEVGNNVPNWNEYQVL